MRFKNMKLRSKLFLAFSAVILFLVINTVIGVFQLNNVKNDCQTLFDKDVWPLETIEAFKSEFTQLRISLNAVVADGVYGDKQRIELGIENFEKQYKATESAYNTALERLKQVGTEDEEIAILNHTMDRISSEYLPCAINICDAALSGNQADLFDFRSKGAALGLEINNEVTEYFSQKMKDASAQTEEAIAASHNAAVALTISGIIALLLAVAISFFMGNIISKPIVKLSKLAYEISTGNLDVDLEVTSNDEIGDLTKDLKEIHSLIKRIVNAINHLSDEFNQGDIDARLNSSGLQGAYKEMVDGMNVMMSDIINEVLLMLGCFGKFGNEGDFAADIPVMPGKKLVMHQTAEAVRNNLIAVSTEINAFVSAAISGNLTERVESEKYKGGWRDIMEALNRLMEAVEKPIYESGEVLRHVAEGNFDYLVVGSYKGEFLNIKECINDVVRNNSSYIDEISEILKELSNDNLDQKIEREYIGKFSDIKIALNNIIEKFNLVISKITSAAVLVSSGAKQVSESSLELAQGATQQAAAVEELNATIQLINQSTALNAENAKKAEKLSVNSKESALKGDSEMKSMLNSIDCIKESSSSISDIIKVIDDIAFQTNILALNATIESARAGINGKGFSAVAEEVRDLAGKSKDAAKETAGLIVESIDKVTEGTKIADTTAESLRDIVEAVTMVAGIVSDIASSSIEQAAAIGQVTEGINQITGVVQSNSETSEESASASEELSGQAEMLKALVSGFRLRSDV